MANVQHGLIRSLPQVLRSVGWDDRELETQKLIKAWFWCLSDEIVWHGDTRAHRG